MQTKSVGIREFRAGLAEFIDNKQPVAVTRHGQTVGYFIPTQGEQTNALAALHQAGEVLDAMNPARSARNSRIPTLAVCMCVLGSVDQKMCTHFDVFKDVTVSTVVSQTACDECM